MAYGRSNMTATLLVDGRVLVAGGSYEAISDAFGAYTAEIFDPATETFSLLDSKMSWGRVNHCAVTLADNTVLLIGGQAMSWVRPSSWDLPSTVDVFDPATNIFTPHVLSGPLPDTTENFGSNCFLLPGNRVFILTSGGPMVLDTNTWQTRAVEWNAGPRPYLSSVAQTMDGKIWIVGGAVSDPPHETSTANIWWFDPRTETVSIAGHLLEPGQVAGILSFPDNSVQIYGGECWDDEFPCSPHVVPTAPKVLTTIEHIDALGISTKLGDLPAPKAAFISVMLQNGKSLHVGGADIDGYSNTEEYVFDESTHIPAVTKDMIEQRVYYGIAPLTTGRVLIVGGEEKWWSGQSNTAEIFEPDASIYVLLPKTTLVPGEFMQLSTESVTHGDVTWAVKYGAITMTGGYTAPSENPNGSADPATTVQDEVIATLSTGAKAVAPITIRFPSLTGP